MSLITIVVILVVVGFLLYLANRYVPMEGRIKEIMNWAVVIAVILWLLKVFGAWEYLSAITV